MACQPKNDLTPKNTTAYSTYLTVTTFDAGIKIEKKQRFFKKSEKSGKKKFFYYEDTKEHEFLTKDLTIYDPFDLAQRLS